MNDMKGSRDVVWFLTVELVPMPGSKMARERPDLRGALVSLVCPAEDGEQAKVRAFAAVDDDGYRVTEVVEFGLFDELKWGQAEGDTPEERDYYELLARQGIEATDPPSLEGFYRHLSEIALAGARVVYGPFYSWKALDA